MSDSGRVTVDGRLSGGRSDSGESRQTREEEGGGVVVIEESGFGWVWVVIGFRVMIRLRKDKEEERALVVLCLRDGEE